MNHYDVIIIGGGAAGLMCAAKAGARGRSVLLLEHNKEVGEKIRISGGGRCNFTNIHCGPQNFISGNKHFAKSALAGYTPRDFIDLVDAHRIKWHEKTLGQLFCDDSANQIIGMLRAMCKAGGVVTKLQTEVLHTHETGGGFAVTTDKASYESAALVVACGGPAIPKMGASGFGYKIARGFGLDVIEAEPALVPLTFTDGFKDALGELSGLSQNVEISLGKTRFTEAMLFTHRGLSGPAVLQISSYWTPGQSILINLAPQVDIAAKLQEARSEHPKQSPSVFMARFMPQKLAAYVVRDISKTNLADLSKKEMAVMAERANRWAVKPAGTEGFRKAEVARGGVNTKELSSKTMEAKAVPSLYFIGEVVDVTGHLGGHNFQWAWASAAACARSI